MPTSPDVPGAVLVEQASHLLPSLFVDPARDGPAASRPMGQRLGIPAMPFEEGRVVADLSGRISRDDRVRSDVLADQTARSDDRPVADRDARQNDRPRADEGVSADHDW